MPPSALLPNTVGAIVDIVTTSATTTDASG